MEELNTDQPSNLGYKPSISPLVKKWMPDASEEELIEATENFRVYLKVLLRISERLAREGKLGVCTCGEGHRDVGTSKGN